MKKQAIGRRIWILALALILAFQVAGVASAASVSWTSGSTYNTATVNKAGGPYYYLQSIPVTKTAHTVGKPTSITTSIARTVNATWSKGGFPTTYNSYLLQAMNKAGLYETASHTVPAGWSVSVPSGASTGNYAMAVGFNYYSASWSIVVQSISRSVDPTAAGPSGSIARALTRLNYIVTYDKI